MFPDMRRKGQLLSNNESEEILKRGTSGVLALSGVDGYPYAVPLSYVYREGKIYFHAAKSGHKIDAIKEHEKASFCVIDQDEILPGEFATAYKSVIAFGKIRILEEEQKIRCAIECLSDRYYPDLSSERDREIEKEWNRLCMMELSVEHLTGKQALKFLRKESDCPVGASLTTLCYIEKDGKYLMLHRTVKENDINKDKWIGVGGHFKPTETPEECLLREVKEETGLTLTSWKFCGIVTFISDQWEEIEYMCLYRTDGFSGELTDCDEGTLKWVDKEKVCDLPIWEGDKIFFRLMEERDTFFSLKLRYEGDVLAEAVLDGEPLKLAP